MHKPLGVFFLLLAGSLLAEPTSVIRWNQQGYAPDQPKEIIVMSQRDLAGVAWSVAGVGSAWQNNLEESELGAGPNTPWGFNHRIDLSQELQEPGDYTLTVGDLDPVVIKSVTGPMRHWRICLSCICACNDRERIR